jgi:hypothetical protein
MLGGEASFLDEVSKRQYEQLSATIALQELHLGALIDSVVYARDLWSFIDFQWFFTFWTPSRANYPFVARKNVTEERIVTKSLADRIKDSGMSHAEMFNVVRAHFEGLVESDSAGKIGPVKARAEIFANSHSRLVAQSQKKEMLFCLLHPNPYFVRMLSSLEQALLSYSVSNAVHELKNLGYSATAIGSDFSDEDFETSFHFVKSGGDRVAELVAAQVREMGAKLQ